MAVPKMNWRAAAQRGIDTERRMKEREIRGLQRGNKAAATIQRLVRKFLKTDYHQSQKKKWERDQRIKERDEKRRRKMRRDKYRTSVSSRSDELNRDRRYIQQIMSKIRDKADWEWEDYGRRPSHDDRMDDYYSEYSIYGREYGDYWEYLEQKIEDIDDRIWELEDRFTEWA